MTGVTIKTIAKEAGVSPSLVSQILNNRPVRVTAEKRAYVEKVAKELHYVPNKLASCLKSKQTNVIAIIAPFTPNGFFSNLIYHIQNYAQTVGYLSMVINTFDNAESEVKALELYRAGLFDGMIIAPRSGNENLDILSNIEKSGFPAIFVDRYQAKVNIPCVSSQHFALGKQLVDIAIKEGKKDIIYLYNNKDQNSALFERMKGYEEGMTEKRLKPTVYSFSQEKGESIQDAMKRTLSTLKRQPEVVFMHSGYYVPYLIMASMSLNYDLNALDFLTVDSFDFNARLKEVPNLLRQMETRCTLAVQDVEAIAINAVDLLLKRISNVDVTLSNDFPAKILRL
ncbi:MAG: LacI family transcriptional regulator [Spirochaetales bacterium]|nr:LacI family transcriptional regulator [Spirochaetales bacterium]